MHFLARINNGPKTRLGCGAGSDWCCVNADCSVEECGYSCDEYTCCLYSQGKCCADGVHCGC